MGNTKIEVSLMESQGRGYWGGEGHRDHKERVRG